jgi:virginiamycin B lyase
MRSRGSRPYGIVLDARGRPWFNLFGTSKLGTIDPATMQLTEIDLPTREARSRRIAMTSDGKVWYVDYAGGYLGRYDPATAVQGVGDARRRASRAPTR